MIDFYYRDRKLTITQLRNINSNLNCYFTDTQDWSTCKKVIQKFLFEDAYQNYLIIHPDPQYIFSKIKKHFTVIQAGGGLVLNEKNELLMIFRRGKWDLPKGKIDAGETIDMTALREVSEETGLTKLQLQNLPKSKIATCNFSPPLYLGLIGSRRSGNVFAAANRIPCFRSG